MAHKHPLNQKRLLFIKSHPLLLHFRPIAAVFHYRLILQAPRSPAMEILQLIIGILVMAIHSNRPAPTISHTYNFQQTASVSLTAVNNHGCSNTLTKNDIIKIHPSLQADFTADKTMICDLPGTVNFSNTSSGAGTLTYEWDFGDGTTSKDKNPSHNYTKKGIHTVKLTVKSSEGCTNPAVKNDYINAGNFNSDIQVPALICEGANALFHK